MSKKENQVHVIHHYGPSPKKQKKKRAPKQKKKNTKKIISVAVNIIDELVRLI